VGERERGNFFLVQFGVNKPTIKNREKACKISFIPSASCLLTSAFMY
jgi:hypothetical protein